MTVKYLHNLEAALVGLVPRDGEYVVRRRLVTNSQERLYDFLCDTEVSLTRLPDQPRFFTPERLHAILEAHPRMRGLKFAAYDLMAIGVFGFLFICEEGRLEGVLRSFFLDVLSRGGTLPEPTVAIV